MGLIMPDSMQTLEAIIRSAGDAIITADAKGDIVTWNPTAERMFGWGEAEVVGQPLTLIIPERFHPQHDDGIARVVTTGETRIIGDTVEVGGLCKDGSEIPVELSLETWVTEGERFFTGIIRDITERKEAEKALQEANQALAQKNEMLEGLSAKLAKYLSKQVYDSIFEGRTEVRVESYRKMLTVFFSDIQGFTELTDRMEPEPLSQLLNGYLSDMSVIALEHGGTVDKFIGDGIMIFFGDPETRGEAEDAMACVRMAMAMRDRVNVIKDEWQRHSGSVELHVRIGINTGYCTVGNFGSEDRLDYTIVGKEVNTTSRLESSAQPDQIQISHDTHELIKHEIRCAPIGKVKVKGLAYPIKTYEVLGLAGDEQAATEGFSLEIDPSKLAPEEAEAAKEALQRALDELERPTSISDEGTS